MYKNKKVLDHIVGHNYKTPFMITDLEVIKQQCKSFKQNMPRLKVYYALKCFSDNKVIETVDKYVDGYDIASTNEIKKLLKLGISPKRMTFSNPVKSETALRKAKSQGINSFAFQSKNELLKIKKCIGNGAKVYIRILVADAEGAISFSSKFGADYHIAVDLLDFAKKIGLNPSGITFHVGSQATEVAAWKRALTICSNIKNDAEKFGITINSYNIGGGYPVKYNDTDPDITEISNVINTALDEFANDVSEIIAEPGRFLVADSSCIVATVIGVEDRGNETWLFLDTGTFQSFIEVFEFHDFPYPVYSVTHLINKTNDTKRKKYVLTGPSCDSYDTMAKGVELPEDLSVGSQLLIDMTGAYTVVYGSNFNGFKVPQRKFI